MAESVREVARKALAKHEVRAKYVGMKGGRESQLRVYPQQPDKMRAAFQITKYIAFETFGDYSGKPMDVGREFAFKPEDEIKDSELCARAFGPDGILKEGDDVILAWNHDYVTMADDEGHENLGPERPVTKLLKLSPETLAKHEVRAVYKGEEEGRESMLRISPQRPNKMWQSFEILEYKHYEKIGEYGSSQRKPGEKFTFLKDEATEEIQTSLSHLQVNDVVEIAWNHDYVTTIDLLHKGQRQAPERPVQKLMKITYEVLSKQEFKAKYVGLREGRESMLRVFPPRPNKMWAFFEVVEAVSYEKLGKYGDAKKSPGEEFGFVPETQPEEVQTALEGLEPGGDTIVFLAYEHRYVTRSDGEHESKSPERVATKLQY